MVAVRTLIGWAVGAIALLSSSMVDLAHAGSNATLTALRGEHRILAAPRHKSDVIGVFRAGQTLKLRVPAPYAGPDAERCEGGWRRVEPRGYVCATPATSADRDHADAVAAREVLPLPGPTPYHYGTSLASPRYRRIPTDAERARLEKKREPASDPASDAIPVASASLVGYLDNRTGPLLHTTGAYGGMKLSFARRFDRDGQRWLVTPDLFLVPAESVKLAPRRRSRLVRIDADHPAPFAIVLNATRRFRLVGGRLEEGDELAVDARVDLADPSIEWRGGQSLAIAANGDRFPDRAVSVFATRQPPPQVRGDDKWVHVRVLQGALIAYEGSRPVFGAVISPGLHGTNPDGDLRSPPGLYRVSAKWHTSDMGGQLGQGQWMTRDVPWVAYYDGSYALHGAWWHDAFGRPRSHGCINLTPPDAKVLFDWLGPELPDGWYAVRADPRAPKDSTLVLVTP